MKIITSSCKSTAWQLLNAKIQKSLSAYSAEISNQLAKMKLEVLCSRKNALKMLLSFSDITYWPFSIPQIFLLMHMLTIKCKTLLASSQFYRTLHMYIVDSTMTTESLEMQSKWNFLISTWSHRILWTFQMVKCVEI